MESPHFLGLSVNGLGLLSTFLRSLVERLSAAQYVYWFLSWRAPGSKGWVRGERISSLRSRGIRIDGA